MKKVSITLLVLAYMSLSACNKAPDVAPMAPAPVAQSATPAPDAMSSAPAMPGASAPAN